MFTHSLVFPVISYLTFICIKKPLCIVSLEWTRTTPNPSPPVPFGEKVQFDSILTTQPQWTNFYRFPKGPTPCSYTFPGHHPFSCFLRPLIFFQSYRSFTSLRPFVRLDLSLGPRSGTSRTYHPLVCRVKRFLSGPNENKGIV